MARPIMVTGCPPPPATPARRKMIPEM